MNQIIKFQFILILVVGLIFPALASYNIEVNESFQNGQCHADITVTPKGNAGDFNIRFYQVGYPNVPHQEFLNVRSSKSIQYTPFYGWAQIVIIIEDRFGCEYSEIITWDCNCEGMSMTFFEQYIEHPLTCDPEDRSGSYKIVGEIVENGVGPYTYAWSDPAIYRSGLLINNFNHGTFTVTATDFRGCTATGEITMIGQNSPERFYYKYSPTCEGQSNGKLAFTYLGQGDHEDDLQISISPTINPNNFLLYFDEKQVAQVEAEGLAAGIYCVTIEDEGTQCYVEDCYEIEELSIEDPFIYNEQSTLQSIVKTCKGEATGSVNIFAAGGIPFNSVEIVEDGVVLPAAVYAYKYRWSDLGEVRFNGLRNGMAEGSYSVTVEDYCGNEISAEVFIPAYPEIEINASMIPGCWPDGGTLIMNSIIGGSDAANFSLSDFEVTWITPDNDESSGYQNNNLKEGVHTIIVRNKLTDCSQEFSKLVDNYPQISFSFESIAHPCFLHTDYHEELFGPGNYNLNRSEGSINVALAWEDGDYFDGEEHLVNDGDPNQVTFNWSDGSHETSLQHIGPNLMGKNFEVNFSLTVIDNKHGNCFFSKSATLKNQIQVIITPVADKCGFEVYCEETPWDYTFIETTSRHKKCCFFDYCHEWECRCLYPKPPSDTPFFWPEEIDMDTEDEETFDLVIQEYKGNCKVKVACPNPGPNYNCGLTAGVSIEDQQDCEWEFGTCSGENMYPDPDFPNELGIPQMEFVSYVESLEEHLPACEEEGQRKHLYELCVKLPKGGGTVIVTRGIFAPDLSSPNGNYIFHTFPTSNPNFTDFTNPLAKTQISASGDPQTITYTNSDRIFTMDDFGYFKVEFNEEVKFFHRIDCHNRALIDPPLQFFLSGSSFNQNFRKEDLVLFPNPANQKVFFNVKNTTSSFIASILSVSGKTIQNKFVDKNDEINYFNIDHLTSGIYIFQVKNDFFNLYKKLVVHN